MRKMTIAMVFQLAAVYCTFRSCCILHVSLFKKRIKLTQRGDVTLSDTPKEVGVKLQSCFMEINKR